MYRYMYMYMYIYVSVYVYVYVYVCLQEDALDLQQLVRDPEKAGRILGCCLLQGSVRTKGLLQILDAEQRFLSEGHGRMPGTYLRIVATSWLGIPVPAVGNSAEVGPHCVVFALSGGCAARLLAARSVDGRLLRDVWADGIPVAAE